MIDITYYGHSCFLLESDVKLLSDPYIRSNKLAKHIDIEDIKPDYVLITHGHNDHVEDAIEIAQNYEAKIISCYEVINWLVNKGSQHNIKINLGGKRNLSEKTSVKYVQAAHSSSMPDGKYGGVAGSYIIQTDKRTIFLAGDTALHSDLVMFGELYSFDLLILPIGGNFTMDLDDAMHAADMLNCDNVIGCHYNTFPEIEINTKQAVELFRKRAGKKLILLEIGQSMSF